MPLSSIANKKIALILQFSCLPDFHSDSWNIQLNVVKSISLYECHKKVQMCNKREIVSLSIWSMNLNHNGHHGKVSETSKTQIVHLSSALHNLYVQVRTIFSGILPWLNMSKVAMWLLVQLSFYLLPELKIWTRKPNMMKCNGFSVS